MESLVKNFWKTHILWLKLLFTLKWPKTAESIDDVKWHLHKKYKSNTDSYSQ